MNDEPYSDSTKFNLIPFYTYYTFFYANSLEVRTFVSGRTIESAGGVYLFENSTIKMRFILEHQRYDIEAKIIKLTRKELNLEYEDKGNTYFLKLYTN